MLQVWGRGNDQRLTDSLDKFEEHLSCDESLHIETLIHKSTTLLHMHQWSGKQWIQKHAITKDGYHTSEDGSCTKQKNSIKNDTTGLTISSTVVVDTNFQKAQQRACQWASNCKECQEPEIEDDLQDHPPLQFLVNSKDFVCNACPSFYCSSSTCTFSKEIINRVWDLYVPFLCYPLLWQPRFLWQSMMKQQ